MNDKKARLIYNAGRLQSLAFFLDAINVKPISELLLSIANDLADIARSIDAEDMDK